MMPIARCARLLLVSFAPSTLAVVACSSHGSPLDAMETGEGGALDASLGDAGAVSDALAPVQDSGSPFESSTTLFPANQLLNPTLPCHDAGVAGDAGDGGAPPCCGAVGDGMHDDTAALQACICAGPVFLPDGTYLVSQTLTWPGPYGMLQGQSRGGTILQLKDNGAAFQAPDAGGAAACVLSTSGHPTDPQSGTYFVSTGFNNFLSNFTVSTGVGNPNACGIQFHGNNVNAIRDVTVRSGDGKGSLGIDLTRPYPGPSMISGVEIDGFETGIGIAQSQYSVTFEHISLHGQLTSGMDVDNNVVSIRDLESTNSVPAIHCAGQGGFVTLIDSNLMGGAVVNSAVVNDAPNGSLFLRNVQTSGYGSAIDNRGALVPGPLTEFVDTDSGAPVTLFPGPTHSLNLPILETPYYHDNDLGDWQDVGPPSSKDDTATIQSALDSGKPIVYFRSGTYYVSDTITVPSSVKQIMGAETLIYYASPNQFSQADAGPPYKALLSVEGGDAGDEVFIERLMFRGPRDSKAAIGVTNIVDNTPRTLVIRDTTVGGGITTPTEPSMGYLTGTSASPVFMDDVGIQAHFTNQQVWIRQYDSEGARSTSPAYFSNTNDGATVWILGLKTESAPTVMVTEHGGKTEILGGLLYTISDDPNHDGGATTPAFTSTDSSISLTFVEEIYNQANIYSVYVQQTDNAVTKSLDTSSLPYHRDGTAHRMPLFVGQ